LAVRIESEVFYDRPEPNEVSLAYLSSGIAALGADNFAEAKVKRRK
jgi:hypothetical protein